MDFVNHIPVWTLAILIFSLRIVDVSIGTIRTITVVQGMLKFSVALGFFEVLIWITAVSQVIARLHESPLLLVAYAGGFASGNAVGIMIERRLAIGNVVMRMITHDLGKEVAKALRAAGYIVTTFDGEGRDGPVTLIYCTLARKEVRALLDIAHRIDPKIFYVIEPARDWRRDSHLQPHRK